MIWRTQNKAYIPLKIVFLQKFSICALDTINDQENLSQHRFPFVEKLPSKTFKTSKTCDFLFKGYKQLYRVK